MRIKLVVLGAILNLATLLAGVVIGVVLVKAHIGIVHAQQVQANPTYEDIVPVMTVGSAGFGVVLAHQIAADSITIQGYDLLKLHDNTLNLLLAKGLVTREEISGVVMRSRAEKLLRVKPPSQSSKGK